MLQMLVWMLRAEERIFGCAEQILVVWAMLCLSPVVLTLVVIVGG